MIVVVIAIVVMVPVTLASITVPLVFMMDTAVVAFPVALEPLASFVPRSDPMRSHVWRASPVSLVPDVAVVHRIPITVHPDIVRTWRDGSHPNHSWRRRRADLDTYGNLRKCCSGQQEQ